MMEPIKMVTIQMVMGIIKTTRSIRSINTSIRIIRNTNTRKIRNTRRTNTMIEKKTSPLPTANH